jgi:hypothetical protein
MRFFIFLMIFLIPSFFWNCSTSDKCRKNSTFTIEYYLGGGFTGFNQGLTIQSDGSVKKWTRSPGADPVYTDSLTLKSEDLDTLCALMTKNDTSVYMRSEKGNYTTVLSLTFNDKTSVISFEGSDTPGDAPQHLIELIAAIRKINTYRVGDL